jgi:GTP-binding protein
VEDMVYFVDLPGYGYAKAPDSEIKKWGEMIEKYLLGIKQMCSIIMLVDIRHEPSAQDIMMYEWLKYYGYKIIIAATKHDKLKKSQVAASVFKIKDKLKLDSLDIVIPFSSESKQGREELWQVIKGFVAEQSV